MIPIVTPAEMRVIDASANEPIDVLIERAGWHVARRARAMLGGVYGRRVLALAGPGNNGADARAAARVLTAWGAHVTVLPPDVGSLGEADLVIDGAFGTGMNRPYEPPSNDADVPVLAIDTPSGVDGLTGAVNGAALAADHTVTFAALKPGLLVSPGANLVGEVEVVDIGLDTTGAAAWLVEEHDVATWLPLRLRDAHKWTRSVFVVGGSGGMYGAPLLASQAALRSGSGIVWCGLPGQLAPGIASEVVFRELPGNGWSAAALSDVERFGAVALGCGMDVDVATEVTAFIAECPVPVVVDGGAIRGLGQGVTLNPSVVLTPHDAEFEALAGSRPGQDRFAAARALAASTGATVLLKGPTTIVASPDGTCLAANAGDQRLATAGTGDVLAGIIASLLAAGLAPPRAAAAGAWLHGRAGQTQAAAGFVASDLMQGLRVVLADLWA